MARNIYPALLASFLCAPMMANHYAGATITYACVNGTTNLYDVTLHLLVDCSGAAVIPQTLSFSSSCGTSFTITNMPVPTGTEVSQLCPSQLANSTCNGGTLPGMQLYEFTTQQFLAPCDGWTISWNICCRASALNLVGNVSTYVETTLNNATALCDASPVFAEAALPYVCAGQLVNYNFGVSDPDGDSLGYALIDARQYVAGDAVPVNYQGGFSGAEPIPGITLDAATGQVSFTPTNLGYYVLAFRADAYNSSGELTGSVVRDILFVVYDCTNNNPDAGSGVISNVTGPVVQTDDHGLTLCGNAAFCFDAAISDPDNGQSLTLSSNVDAVLPGASIDVSGTNPATATVCWDAQGAAPGVYVFTITASDDACPQPASQILSYSINLLESTSASPDTAICPGGTATLSAFGGTAFFWTPFNLVSDRFLQQVQTSPSLPTTFTVTSDLLEPCNTAEVTVTILGVSDPACLNTSAASIVMEGPSLFPSPNGGSFVITGMDPLQRIDVLDVQGQFVVAVAPWQQLGLLEVSLPPTLSNGRYTLRAIGKDMVHVLPFELMR